MISVISIVMQDARVLNSSDRVSLLTGAHKVTHIRQLTVAVVMEKTEFCHLENAK